MTTSVVGRRDVDLDVDLHVDLDVEVVTKGRPVSIEISIPRRVVGRTEGSFFSKKDPSAWNFKNKGTQISGI